MNDMDQWYHDQMAEVEFLRAEVERLKAELSSGRITVQSPDDSAVYSLKRADVADVWRLLDDVRRRGETAPAAVARLMGEREALRERAESAERERDAIIGLCVHEIPPPDPRRPRYTHWSYEGLYRPDDDDEDETESGSIYVARDSRDAAVAAVRKAAGLDAAPAGDSGG